MKKVLRRHMALAAAAAAAVLGWISVTPASVFASPVSLVVSQGTAFTVLGHSCGGIKETAYGAAFDSTTGYPDGDVHLSTTCSAGGKGGHSVTYTAWISTTWDFTGAMVSYAKLSSAPSVNATLSVYDSHGNHLYNQPPFAYLVLASGFVPAPRVSAVSPSSAPQGSTITITGTSFAGATQVTFGTYTASFTINSSTSITATAPAVRTGAVDVSVTGPGGTSLVDTSDHFTFTRTPRVGSVNPTTGSADGGTSVTISGANFTGATSVAFGGVAASFTISSDDSIVAVSPGVADPVTVDVTVSSAYGTSALNSSDRYTYT